MGKWKGVILIIVLQLFYLLGCASEEVKEAPKPVKKEVSCTFNQLDGECKYFDNGTTLCSTGTCSEGDCITGKGVITYPGGSILEGFFKDGKLNGAGSYKGCSGSFVGTFKNDFKEKGIFVSKDSNKIYEGTFKDELKSGNFNVYLDYNQQFPFAENGKVLAEVYSKKIAISFVMDMDKIDYDKEEAARKKFQKEAEAEKKRLLKQVEDEEKLRAPEVKELLKILKEEKDEQELENRRRKKEEAEEERIRQLREKENQIEEKGKADCIESRYKYSKECTIFEKKYNYNPIKGD